MYTVYPVQGGAMNQTFVRNNFKQILFIFRHRRVPKIKLQSEWCGKEGVLENQLFEVLSAFVGCQSILADFLYCFYPTLDVGKFQFAQLPQIFFQIECRRTLFKPIFSKTHVILGSCLLHLPICHFYVSFYRCIVQVYSVLLQCARSQRT